MHFFTSQLKMSIFFINRMNPSSFSILKMLTSKTLFRFATFICTRNLSLKFTPTKIMSSQIKNCKKKMKSQAINETTRTHR